MAKITGHLDEDQIITAITDEQGLDGALCRHLSDCSACRAEKEALEKRLFMFGHMARESVPQPVTRPRLRTMKTTPFKRTWRIKPAFGMGLAFASLLALLLNPYALNLFKPAKDVGLEKVYLEMLQDERFMAEIETLEENTLPKFYVEILDISDTDASDDQKDSKIRGGQEEKLT